MATMYKTQVGEIVRDMTETEIIEYKLVLADIDAQAQVETEAKDKRQALLAKLGITEEEARLLLGGN